MKILFVVVGIFLIQSDHKFAHVMTAQLSWLVQNCDLLKLLFFKLKKQIFLWDLNYEAMNDRCNGPYPMFEDH